MLMQQIDMNNEEYIKADSLINLVQQNLINNSNANQKYNDLFKIKIQAWRQNHIKSIDHNSQKMNFKAIANDSKTKDAFRQLLNSIKQKQL